MLTDPMMALEASSNLEKHQAIAYHVREILNLVGEDTNREGLLDTPVRVAKMFDELLAGMTVDLESVLNTTFEEHTEGPVIVKDITFYSLCEHHMIPFFGKAHVAYIPGTKIVGLSKLARLVDAASTRLQVQERMTEQIAQTIETVLEPRGVMILVEAEHTCMCARGVKKPGSTTTTLATRGLYRENYELRREFFQMIGR